MIGRTLGRYKVTSLLGKGGMGEVYLAKDASLDRDVAIKLLPASMVSDEERVRRFEREAKLSASLNHSNVAHIYGFEETDEQKFLVLEFVEGHTLASRVKSGPIPVQEALAICEQIAEALEAAHQKGIIHRDLKPGNVMLTPTGHVKVLDFGLARALSSDQEPEAGGDSQAVTLDSPTITNDFTRTGVLLGTAAYMSPEQARGRPLDKRTDIWSFGVILYECLTGQTLYAGESAADSLGAVLHREPEWDELPSTTPPTVRLLLRRCLQKDRKRRLHDIADARIELDEVIADPSMAAIDFAGLATRSRSAKSRTSLLVWLAVPVFALVAAFAAWQSKPSAPPPALRKLEVHVDGLQPDELLLPTISPDGTRIAYVAGDKLWARSLDDLEAIELAGTDGAQHPFWSPDSKQLGFHDGSRLWRIPAGGGDRKMICTTPQRFGLRGQVVWTEDARVFFTTAWGGGQWEVPVGGGEPRPTIELDAEFVRDLHYLSVLPNRGGFLCVLHPADGRADTIVRIAGGSLDVVLEHPDEEIFAPIYSQGYILYGRAQTTGTIWAVPYSLASHETTGSPFLVAESADHPSVSNDGLLIYAESAFVGSGQLAWVDRTGSVTDLIGLPQEGLDNPVLAPGGTRAAARATEIGSGRIWIHDLVQATRRPFSPTDGLIWIADWASDDQLVYVTGTETYMASIAGSKAPELLGIGGRARTSISSDRRYVAFERRVTASLDIYFADLEAGTAAQPLLASDATESTPTIRPGGGWMAYVSNETGRNEIYLVTFPSGANKRRVSLDGGIRPQWSRDSKQLFFQSARSGDAAIIVVEVSVEPELRLTQPTSLFTDTDTNISLERRWSVSADGQRILGVQAVMSEPDTRSITVVENWSREFEEQ